MGSFTDVSPPERQQEQTVALMASGVVGRARIDQVTDTGAPSTTTPGSI